MNEKLPVVSQPQFFLPLSSIPWKEKVKMKRSKDNQCKGNTIQNYDKSSFF